MKNKILITGGAGYIGSHVANLLIDQGYSVSIIDSLITGHKNLVPNKSKLYICDIADRNIVPKIIEEGNFDLLMHFAGLIRVDESVKEPEKYNNYNCEKTKIFLDMCFEGGLDKIIFSSTASVYGNPKKDKVSEDDELDPLNPYALSKLRVENFLINKSKNLPIKYIILRYFNVAGASPSKKIGQINSSLGSLFKNVSIQALKKKPKIHIYGDKYNTKDGTCIRDYIHVSDLAAIHVKIIEYLDENDKFY